MCIRTTATSQKFTIFDQKIPPPFYEKQIEQNNYAHKIFYWHKIPVSALGQAVRARKRKYCNAHPPGTAYNEKEAV